TPDSRGDAGGPRARDHTGGPGCRPGATQKGPARGTCRFDPAAARDDPEARRGAPGMAIPASALSLGAYPNRATDHPGNAASPPGNPPASATGLVPLRWISRGPGSGKKVRNLCCKARKGWLIFLSDK